MKPATAVLVTGVLLSTVVVPGYARKGEFTVYVGTYTRESSKGIYAWRFDSAKGSFTPIGLVAETSNPSFLAIHPNGRFLYAVNENNDGKVSAFSIDRASHKLTPLNQVSTKGPGPCHLALDKTGKVLFAANYSGGSTAAFPVHADGSLGEASAFVQHSGSSVNPQRQRGPHAHSTVPTPDNRFLLVADLGLDQVLSYRIDTSNGTLAPSDPPFAKVAAGSGPRHIAFHPNGKFAYVVNEMAATVTAFTYGGKGLQEIATVSMLPKDYNGPKGSAEIAVHPNGRFLYASNRAGHDTIAVFSIDRRTGAPAAIDFVSTQGKTPRNFAIDPTGNYLFAANQDSGTIVLFRIDPKTGKLSATGSKMETPFPVSIVFAE